MQALSTLQALNLLQKHWHIKGEIKALPSYADQNFKISTATQSYVFKIANPQWSSADVELENAALLHLEKTCTTLTLPKVVASVDGRYLIPICIDDAANAQDDLDDSVEIGNQSPCYLRLLTYVDGDVYAHVAARTDKTPAQRSQLLQSLGRAVGKVAYGMRDFIHPNAQRHLDWNMIHLPSLMTEVNLLEENDLQSIVQKHMQTFAQQLPHWLSILPLSVNHNDANDFNVIVDPLHHQQVTALIDFGDTCTSFRIADVAIACTYAIAFEEDIVEAMSLILQGYHQENPLQKNEVDVLYQFVMARLCQSILMANKAFRHDPNNAYILVSQKAVRSLLHRLDALGEDMVSQRLVENL